MGVPATVAISLVCFYAGMVYGTRAAAPPPRMDAAPLPALDFGQNSPRPTELSASERSSSELRYKLPVMDVELRFLSAVEWRQRLGDDADVMAGFTYWIDGPFYQSGRPCRVFLPSQDADVVYAPGTGAAHWEDPHFGRTVAHELLHCARGAWHPPWSEIAGRMLKEHAP